ncbi:Ecto-NOX disulfide-thiol exchanger 1 [Liparis tanakae]|uniref:Ecto-NOX disulfide-thiol exchanger 1 n=1 Tax=Liparis tanakae TaxID=230148 RepID=A0A4Z2I1Z0_9TELE|nr:Ecto-NOX disulfide-thiol exchanger 1 [Liparis tanakae]
MWRKEVMAALNSGDPTPSRPHGAVGDRPVATSAPCASCGIVCVENCRSHKLNVAVTVALASVTLAGGILAEAESEDFLTRLTEGICNMTMDSNSMAMPMSDPNPWATAMNNLGMPPIGISGQQLMQGLWVLMDEDKYTDPLRNTRSRGNVSGAAKKPSIARQLGSSSSPVSSHSDTWLETDDFDPGLGMMAGISPLNPMMPGLGMAPGPLSQDFPVIKEIIHCKSCTLFPPNPIEFGSCMDLLFLTGEAAMYLIHLLLISEALVKHLGYPTTFNPGSFQRIDIYKDLPPPATRERPPGCKTVFVGGLPENSTEQLIVEVFGQCGEIIAIRKSKKNFCHIRFAEEFTVDRALFLSGYRIRLGSSTDKKDTGRLHVDFAQARDDFYEWECHQRMLAREERHRRKMEEDRLRPPSPPPIVHYSEHECSQLGDKIKDDGKFPEAVRVLMTWLERGEVNRRNANNFYSMIQSSNGHIRRLTGEKTQHEKEVEEAKDKFKIALAGIVGQFEQIVSVFQAASKQKAWDHFSKAQRKNLDMWRKQAESEKQADR